MRKPGQNRIVQFKRGVAVIQISAQVKKRYRDHFTKALDMHVLFGEGGSEPIGILGKGERLPAQR